MERLRNDMCDVVNAYCVLYSPLACRSSRVVIARDSIVTGALTDPQSFCGGCHLCSQALKLRSAIAACVTFSLVQPPQCPLRPCLPTLDVNAEQADVVLHEDVHPPLVWRGGRTHARSGGEQEFVLQMLGDSQIRLQSRVVPTLRLSVNLS